MKWRKRMKKFLIAALLLLPCSAYAADYSFKNRINVAVNGAYTDAMGDFEKALKAAEIDRTNFAFGISAGFGLFEWLEPGLEFQYFGKYSGTHSITNTKNEDTIYMGGIYLKAYLPTISLSDSCGLDFYGKVGSGRYYQSIKSKPAAGLSQSQDKDDAGFSAGMGFDFTWDHMFTGIEYRLHRADEKGLVSSVGLNVGYRF